MTDVDELLDEDALNDLEHEYGQPPERPWLTAPLGPGQPALSVTRPELLDDGDAGGDLGRWLHDLKSWSLWMIETFGVQKHFPPCWPEHPALVEELTALWALWQDGWVPATDNSRPVYFLAQLDAALSRCERRWQVTCDPSGAHKNPPRPTAGANGQPTLRRWWGNDHFNERE